MRLDQLPSEVPSEPEGGPDSICLRPAEFHTVGHMYNAASLYIQDSKYRAMRLNGRTNETCR